MNLFEQISEQAISEANQSFGWPRQVTLGAIKRLDDYLEDAGQYADFDENQEDLDKIIHEVFDLYHDNVGFAGKAKLEAFLAKYAEKLIDNAMED